MDIAAKLTSKGQITVPKAVRDTLALKPGDQVLFRVEDNRAIIARTKDFLELAGSVAVPSNRKGRDWDDIRRETRSARARKRA
ncbi:MAG TPA: AbrB/MazE/SpoVT family DNA-binding domain-containing protein [Solirubrobacterales bacterium]|nr:AbrB/MazE/SpoVT family DNA-binding domain-containing protein [Solirubrobacterales bacterium]